MDSKLKNLYQRLKQDGLTPEQEQKILAELNDGGSPRSAPGRSSGLAPGPSPRLARAGSPCRDGAGPEGPGHEPQRHEQQQAVHRVKQDAGFDKDSVIQEIRNRLDL